MDVRRKQSGTTATGTDVWRQISALFLLYPIISLTLLFWAWKSLLFVIIVNSPGPGYDTSTTLLPSQRSDALSALSQHPHFSSAFLKFVRWDSIYFIQIVERGYLFEQEWAFGFGYTKLLTLLSSCTFRLLDVDGVQAADS
jgi:GPI mannosyltransferase 2